MLIVLVDVTKGIILESVIDIIPGAVPRKDAITAGFSDDAIFDG